MSHVFGDQPHLTPVEGMPEGVGAPTAIPAPDAAANKVAPPIIKKSGDPQPAAHLTAATSIDPNALHVSTKLDPKMQPTLEDIEKVESGEPLSISRGESESGTLESVSSDEQEIESVTIDPRIVELEEKLGSSASSKAVEILGLVATENRDELLEVFKMAEADETTKKACEEALKAITSKEAGFDETTQSTYTTTLNAAKCAAAISTCPEKNQRTFLSSKLSDLFNQKEAEYALQEAIYSFLPPESNETSSVAVMLLFQAALATEDVNKVQIAVNLMAIVDPSIKDELIAQNEPEKEAPNFKFWNTEQLKQRICNNLSSDVLGRNTGNILNNMKEIKENGTGDPVQSLKEAIIFLKSELVTIGADETTQNALMKKYCETAQTALTVWLMTEKLSKGDGTLAPDFYSKPMETILTLAKEHGVDHVKAFKAAMPHLKGVTNQQKEQIGLKIYGQLLKKLSIGAQTPKPSSIKSGLLQLLENKIDVQSVLDSLLSSLDKSDPAKAFQNRALAQEQLHIARVAYAIEKKDSGLFQLETSTNRKERIAQAKTLLTTNRKDISKKHIEDFIQNELVAHPMADAIRNRDEGSLPSDIKEAIVSGDLAKIQNLYALALDGKVDLGKIYYQIMDALRPLPPTEKLSQGLAEFFKQNVQASAELKQYDHLQKLFAHFPDLQSLGIKETPQDIVKTMIGQMKQDDAKTFMSQVYANFKAIASVPYERHRMHPLDMFRVSVFANRELEKSGYRLDVQYFSGKIAGIPRSIMINFQTHDFVVLSKKFGDLQAYGTYKLARDAVLVGGVYSKNSGLVETAGRRLVALVNRAGQTLDPQELAYEMQYADVMMMTKYASSKTPGEQKTIYVQEAFDSNLEKAIASLNEEVAIPQKINFMMVIGDTLEKMHRNGDIQGDLKMENVIARRNNDGTWTIRVADFGLTYNPRTGETRVGYGTPEYTSPEYLKRKGYIEFVTEQGLEDRVKQAMSDDMFALGCLLYEVLHPGIELPWAVATGQIIRREIAYDNVKKEVIPILEVLEEQYNDQVVKEAIHTVRNTLRTWIGKTDVLMASYEFLHEVVNSEELIENGLLIDRLTELNTNLVDAERIRAFDVLEKMEKAHSKDSDVNSIKSLKEKVKNGTGNEEQFNAFLTKLSTWEEGAYVNLEAMDKGLFDKDRVDALNTLRMAISELNPVSPEKKKLAQEQPAYGLSLICAKLLDEDPKMRLTASQFKAALKIIQEKKAEEFEAELAKTTQAVSLSQPVLGAIG